MRKLNVFLFLTLCSFVVGCSNNEELNKNELEESNVVSEEVNYEDSLNDSNENNKSLDFIEVVSNESILYDDALKIKVTGYQTLEEFSYTNIVYEEKNIKPNEGEIFVVVRYSVENVGKEAFYSAGGPLTDIKIQSDSGYVYDAEGNGEREGLEKSFNLEQGETNLNPLGKSVIYILYPVNKEMFEKEGFSAYYKQTVEEGHLQYKDIEQTVKFK